MTFIVISCMLCDPLIVYTYHDITASRNIASCNGHDELTWNNITGVLRTVGYDSVLSIEHEDSLISADEAFESDQLSKS